MKKLIVPIQFAMFILLGLWVLVLAGRGQSGVAVHMEIEEPGIIKSTQPLPSGFVWISTCTGCEPIIDATTFTRRK